MCGRSNQVRLFSSSFFFLSFVISFSTTVTDTVIAVYTSSSGACTGTFTQLAGSTGCDDDIGSTCRVSTQSSVISPLTSGTTYYIVVYYTGPSTVPINKGDVQIAVLGAPVNDVCSGTF